MLEITWVASRAAEEQHGAAGRKGRVHAEVGSGSVLAGSCVTPAWPNI